jgi:hypothetical protein
MFPSSTTTISMDCGETGIKIWGLAISMSSIVPVEKRRFKIRIIKSVFLPKKNKILWRRNVIK